MEYSSFEPAPPLRDLTHDMGSHGVTCSLTEMTFLPLPQQITAGMDSCQYCPFNHAYRVVICTLLSTKKGPVNLYNNFGKFKATFIIFGR